MYIENNHLIVCIKDFKNLIIDISVRIINVQYI